MGFDVVWHPLPARINGEMVGEETTYSWKQMHPPCQHIPQTVSIVHTYTCKGSWGVCLFVCLFVCEERRGQVKRGGVEKRNG